MFITKRRFCYFSPSYTIFKRECCAYWWCWRVFKWKNKRQHKTEKRERAKTHTKYIALSKWGCSVFMFMSPSILFYPLLWGGSPAFSLSPYYFFHIISLIIFVLELVCFHFDFSLIRKKNHFLIDCWNVFFYLSQPAILFNEVSVIL